MGCNVIAKADNNNPSILFNDLLYLNDNNIEQTITDYITNRKDKNGAVDVNGEPIVSRIKNNKPNIAELYDTIPVVQRYKGKAEYLKKHGIKVTPDKRYYYVLDENQTNRVENYIKKARYDINKIGSSKEGFQLVDNKDHTITVKVYKKKAWLLIDDKEYRQQGDVILPTIISRNKLHIQLVPKTEESKFLQSIRENTTYVPFIEKLIKIYGFKTGNNISPGRAANFYLLQLKSLLIDQLSDYSNLDLDYSTFREMSEDDINEILKQAQVKAESLEIEKYKKTSLNFSKEELIEGFTNVIIPDLNEEELSNIKNTLEYLPVEFLRLIDFSYSSSYLFNKGIYNPSSFKASMSFYNYKDGIQDFDRLHQFVIGLALNVALKNMVVDGVVPQYKIDAANKTLETIIAQNSTKLLNKEFVSLQKVNTLKQHIYNLDDVLPTYWGKAIDEIIQLAGEQNKGFTQLIFLLAKQSEEYVDPKTEVKLSYADFLEADSYNGLKPSIIFLHELGHALDYYAVSTNFENRKKYTKLLQDIANDDRLVYYNIYGLMSRGYTTLNKKEIIADLNAYVLAKALNINIDGTHLEHLDKFFNDPNNYEFINSKYNKYFETKIEYGITDAKVRNLVQTVDGTTIKRTFTIENKKSHPIIEYIRDLINKVIRELNKLIGHKFFAEYTSGINIIEYNVQGIFEEFIYNGMTYQAINYKDDVLKMNYTEHYKIENNVKTEIFESDYNKAKVLASEIKVTTVAPKYNLGTILESMSKIILDIENFDIESVFKSKTRNEFAQPANIIDNISDIKSQVINTGVNGIKRLNYNETLYGINILSSLIYDSHFKLKTLTLKDAIKGNTVKETVLDLFSRLSSSYVTRGIISADQHEVNSRIIQEARDENSLLWEKVKIDANLNSNITITELEDIDVELDNISNTFDENLQFKITPDSRVSTKIKNIINNTKRVINNNNEKEVTAVRPGGFATKLRSHDVIPHLVQELYDASSVQDMLSKFNRLVRTNPSYQEIYNSLIQSEALANLFFSNFKNSALKRVYLNYNPEAKSKTDQVSLDVKNKDSFTEYQLADNWNTVLKSRFNADFYNSLNLTEKINDLYERYKTSVGDRKLAHLSHIFRLLGLNIKDAALNEYVYSPENRVKVAVPQNVPTGYKNIDDFITTTLLNNLTRYLLDNIVKYINNDNIKIVKGKKENILDSDKLLLDLAKKIKSFYVPDTIGYINIEGNQEQTFNKPTYLSDWFSSIMKNDDVFLTHLKNMASDKSLRYSSWLFNHRGHNGFLNLPKGVTLDNLDNNIDRLTLNKSFYYDELNDVYLFDIYFNEGIASSDSNKSIRYQNIDDFDWSFINIINYINGNRFSNRSLENQSNKNNALYTIPAPADRGNSVFISAPRYELSASEMLNTTTISHNSRLYRAIVDIFKQELTRIDTAQKRLFRIDNDNNVIQTPIEDLRSGYHYALELGRDNVPRVVIFKDGKLAGNAFKFHNFHYIDNKGNLVSLNDIFDNTPTIEVLNDRETMAKVYSFIDKMISNIIKTERTKNIDNQSIIAKLSDRPFDRVIAEYALNRTIFNNEMLNFFIGDIAFYGSADKANKRVTQLLSSGIVNGAYGTNTLFYGVTANDTIVESTISNDIEDTLRVLNYPKSKIRKILDFYTKVDTTNGISYITLDEYERRLKLFGVIDKYSNLIDKLKDINNPIDIKDLEEVVQSQKNFYYSYTFDPANNIMFPTQVKNSEVVLIPRLLKDNAGNSTELGLIHDVMVKLDIGQLNFEQSEKVGNKYVAILSKNGVLQVDTLEEELTKGRRSYQYTYLRKQQEVVNHIMDESNKVGVQFQKKILDNVEEQEVIDEVFDLTISNIEEGKENLFEELGVKSVNSKYEVDVNKLQKILISKYIQQNLNDNFVYGISIDPVTNTFIAPLDMPVIRSKNEAILNSLFTNNVVIQKHPGAHGPQVSNAFMRSIIAKSGVKKASQLPTSNELKYMKYTSKNGKLVFHKAQIMLPAWSKRFFKNRNITIEDLKNAGLDVGIAYRIPTEGKQSMFVFEVVDFLNSTQGSSIVIPSDFLAQSGADFDLDTLYSMNYNFRVDENGQPERIVYHTDNKLAYEDRYGKALDKLAYLEEIISEFTGVNSKKAIDLIAILYDDVADFITEDERAEAVESEGYTYLHYKKLRDIAATFPPYEEFSKIKEPTKFNSKKARQNRQLEIYMNILSNPKYYVELVTPNEFEDTEDARAFAESFYDKSANTVNFITPDAQDIFRKKAMAGRLNKGISVNDDSFLSIAQKVGLKVNPDKAIQIQFNIDKDISVTINDKVITSKAYKLEELKTYFGEENVTDDGIVTLQYLANDYHETNKTINGDYITRYVSQATSHILDSVKFPLPFGASNAVNEWRLLPTMGASWITSTLLINQSSVNLFNDYTVSKNQITSDFRGNPYYQTKKDIIAAILSLYTEETFPYEADPVLLKQTYRNISKGITKYISNDMVELVESNIAKDIIISDKFLIDNLKNRKAYRSLNTEDSLNYLIDQFNILRYYQKVVEISNAIGRFQRLTSFDKTRVGPEFIDIANLQDLYESVKDGEDVITLRDGSNYVNAIYEGDAHRLLRAFKENAFDLSYEVFNEYFITQSEPFKVFVNTYPKEVRNTVINYMLAYNMNDLQFFNNTDVNRLLGISSDKLTNLDITKHDYDTLESYKRLSVIDKLTLVKQVYSEYIEDGSLLKYLQPVATKEMIDNVGHPVIEFVSDRADNYFIEQFNALWYNNNMYLHLLAQDLVRYSYFVNGMTFGRNISKIIPIQILASEPETLTDAFDEPIIIHENPLIKGIGFTSHLAKKRNEHFTSDFINPYDIAFRINLSRANWRNSKLVPKIVLDKVPDDRGGSYYRKGAVTWTIPAEDGTVRVSFKQFNRFDNNFKRANVVKLYTKSGVKLFAPLVTSEEVIYIPVSPLNNFEFNSKSRVEKNNTVDKSLDEYLNEYYKTNIEDNRYNEYDALADWADENALLVDYVNHSGGAYGADTFWDIIGREYGVINHNHYRDSSNTKISDTLKKRGVKPIILSKEQMDKARAEIKKLLNKTYSDNLQGNLQVRNYYQVSNSDAVFAIGNLANKQGKYVAGEVYYDGVHGGTNTAVQLGIALNKPVYVYDLGTLTWTKWNGKYFEETETPVLTKNFAGVGTRDIQSYNVLNKTTNEWETRKEYEGEYREEKAKQAVRDVYEKTLAKVSTGENINIETPEEVYSKIGTVTKSKNIKIVLNPNKYLSEQIKGKAVVAYKGAILPESFENPFHVRTDKTTKENVISFIDFVLNSTEPQAVWIREQLQSGKFKNKPIYYGNTKATKNNEPSHATALDYLINKYDWGSGSENNNTNYTQGKLFATIIDNVEDDFLKYNKSRIEYVKGIMSDYNIRMQTGVSNKLLEQTVENLNKLNWGDNFNAAMESAFRINLDYISITIKQLESMIHGSNSYSNPDVLRAVLQDETKRYEFTRFMNYMNVFIKGFSKIETLQPIRKDNLSKEEERLNRYINKTISFGNKINQLKTIHKAISNTYFELLLTPISTNPDIKLGIRKVFDTQNDETKIQLLLDSIFDTHHSFLANFAKKFYIDRERYFKEYKDLIVQYEDKIEELRKKGYNLSDILDGENRLIQEFDDSYKEDLDKHWDKVMEAELKFGKYSIQYYNAEKAFKLWQLENMNSELQPQVEKALFNANDILYSHFEARKALDLIKQAKRKILDNYDGIVDYSQITETDIQRLEALERQRKQLANFFDENGDRKEGEELKIAETLSKYDDAHSQILNDYYKEVINNKVYEELLKKHKKTKTSKTSRDWLLRNTRIKVLDKFWTELEKFATVLGKKESSELLKALKPYKDKDGVVNGNLVSPNLAAKVKEDNEKRVEDATGEKRLKAIKKPKTGEVYNDDYYSQFKESKKGTDSRETNKAIVAINNAIEEILSRYIGEEGTVDTTTIPIDDLEQLYKLSNELLLYRSYGAELSRNRVKFNRWFGDAHDSNIDQKAFDDAESFAKSISKKYHNAWLKANTELHYTKDYFEQLKALKADFGFSTDEVKAAKIDNVNMDALQNLYKVDSFEELPENIKDIIVKNHFNRYRGKIGKRKVYTLKEYMTEHNWGEDKIKFPSIKSIQKELRRIYLHNIDKENTKDGSNPFHLEDYLLDNFYEYETTQTYKNRLKKYGEDSEWFLKNHTVNHKGDIVPVAYWLIKRPKDKSLYQENAPKSRLWGYTTVKDKEYIDPAKTEARQWMDKHVSFKPTPYYEETKLRKRNELPLQEYMDWFEANHFYNPYTMNYEPISIWTTMVPSDEYIDEYYPIKSMLSQEIKARYSNVQETVDKHNEIAKKEGITPTILDDPYRSVYNKPLPKKTSKYHYNNRANKNPKYKTYDEVKANPLYSYITNLLGDLTSHYSKDTIIDEQKLPIMIKTRVDNAQDFAKSILHKMGYYNYPSREVTGENNESIRILNMPFVNDLIKKEIQQLPNEKEFDTREQYLERLLEVKKENEEAKKFNREYTLARMDNNFEDVIKKFIIAAKTHKFQYEKEHEMRMALEEIRNLSLAKQRSMLTKLRNITRERLAKTREELFTEDNDVATKSGVGSNLENHFLSFIDMIFYGEFEKDEGNWTKIARVIQNVTSMKGMWINAPGAFNNVAYGKTQIALERFSGYFFNNSDRLYAEKQYMQALPYYFAEIGKHKSNNLTNALIKYFDIIELQDELAITNNIELDKSLKKYLLSTNTMYVLHHMGEHYMQNVGMLSMLHSHKIINGKIQSFADYTWNKQYNALQNVLDAEGKASLEKFIKNNKNKDIYLDNKSDMIRDFILSSDENIKSTFLSKLKELKEQHKKEFDSESFTRVTDAFELVDGLPVLKKGIELSQDEISRFKLKMIKVNQKIHGIYNKMDAGTMQKYALGRLAIQFKKWMRPGWVKRFGARGNKTHWNEARDEYETGMYVSTFRFLTKPIGDAIANHKDLTFTTAMSNILTDYRNYVSNIGLYWHTLNDTDKANVRKTAIEMLYFAGVSFIMLILQGLANGEDDDKKWAYLLYATDRLKTEILAFNPFYGFTNETRKLLRDPFAAMAVMDDISKLIWTAFMERDERYKGGIYHGESKLHVQLYKNIPILNRWLRYENIQDYAGYYKLY